MSGGLEAYNRIKDDLERKSVRAIYNEYCKAAKQYDPFNGPHEGWAVIKEEMDELWSHVKT